MGQLKVVAIAGSLRRESYNRELLQIAKKLASEQGAPVEEVDLKQLALPIYDGDIEAQGLPAPVRQLKATVEKADVLLIATPEYNYSIPGVLKNAIDWASRPPDPPLDGKPVAMMGASTGNFGTVRAQLHLRHVCVYCNMFPVNKPEVLVMRAREKFDASGRLVDEITRGFVRDLLAALADWTHRLQ